MTTKYNDDFFLLMSADSLKAANVVVPVIMDLLEPKSVLDLGTGQGGWLSVFKANGVKTVLGYDGAYVQKNTLLISGNEFIAVDLNAEYTITQKFDLSMSLEVAEHLEEVAAERLIQQLTNASNMVLFSAAVPNQGGTGHINEKAFSEWSQLFKKYDFVEYDILRPIFWEHKEVLVCYKQNLVLYVKKGMKEIEKKLENKSSFRGLNIIHPEMLAYRNQRFRELIAEIFNKKQYTLLIDILSNKVNPDPLEIYYLGRALKELKEFELAIKNLIDYVGYKNEKYISSAYFHLGEIYFQKEELAEAKKYLVECINCTSDKHEKAMQYLKVCNKEYQ